MGSSLELAGRQFRGQPLADDFQSSISMLILEAFAAGADSFLLESLFRNEVRPLRACMIPLDYLCNAVRLW